MKNNGLMKLFSIVAFVALMIISCWATTESLHLLLPQWPRFIFWIVTIAFFVLSALGTKMIIDGCDKEVDADHPGRKIVGGILILLFFWVIFSIPTNTHTFFYKATIQDVLTQDLTNTKAELQSLNDDQMAAEKINGKKREFDAEVEHLFNNVADEVRDQNNPGWGPKAIAAQGELEKTLGRTIQIPKMRNESRAGRQEFVEELYRRTQEAKLIRLKQFDQRLEEITKHKDSQAIQENIKKITATQDKIKKYPANNGEPTIATEDVLNNSYFLIVKYYQGLDEEELRGKANEYNSNLSQTAKMRNVTTVWRGMLKGDDLYKGRGLWYWVIVALMIDIAGFIFFDIAFRKRDY